jgi:hypothetical protein
MFLSLDLGIGDSLSVTQLNVYPIIYSRVTEHARFLILFACFDSNVMLQN